jgi:integrase
MSDRTLVVISLADCVAQYDAHLFKVRGLSKSTRNLHRHVVRNLMSALFHHAMRYEWIERNPIKLVRQSAKREKVPDVLELAELQLLLSKLAVRERTLALLDAATGLRVSELLALRWDDVDFKNLEIRVTESIWHQVVGVCKTEASAKPVPMDEYMAEDLRRWRRNSP